MKTSISFTTLLSSLAIASNALPTISTKGSKFFTSNGDQWYVKGVAYQLSPDDPLMDTAQCERDFALMKRLGANAIRVYHVANGDHSGCMTAAENAGIYLFVDLDTFTTQVTATDPMWTLPQKAAFQAVMDEFQQYDNTAGFFIGNEVLSDQNHTEAAVFVKAATRDMKAYRDSKGYRQIPIGYSHADIAQLRPSLQNYLVCGSNTSESIDFFGLNAYEWCGSNTYSGSGYSILTSEIIQYPIPIFFSETGCATPEPRYFQDQNAIFGPKMTPYWSGAIVYEWIQEENHFGLITYGGETDAVVSIAGTDYLRSGTPTPITPDFYNLLNAWATVSPSSISKNAYTPSNTAPPCPAYTESSWEIAGNVALPSLGATYNAAVQYSITKDQAMTATFTASATTATTTAGAVVAVALPGKELLAMSVALSGVMFGFLWWL